MSWWGSHEVTYFFCIQKHSVSRCIMLYGIYIMVYVRIYRYIYILSLWFIVYICLMERYGEYMSDGNMMPAFQLVKSKSRRRCRKAFNVVPAQALMELFLSEEGLIHKRLHGNVIHLIHLIQNEIYLSLKGICDMNEIGHKSHRSHRGQNRVRTESEQSQS